MADVLSKQEVDGIDAYWRAANYLSVGQIYLLDNPLLTEPLALEHIKPRLLGHWGTSAYRSSARSRPMPARRCATS
jgi:xylulose-5-phosphate/fructose-6-phosphate phosphoketolase